MGKPLSVGVLGYRFMGKAYANVLVRLPMFFPDAPDVERRVIVVSAGNTPSSTRTTGSSRRCGRRTQQ